MKKQHTSLLVKFIVNAFSLFLVAKIVNGIELTSIGGLIWGVILLWLFNVTLKPLLLVLTLPVNVLTLGLFTLVINAIIFIFVSRLVPGFFVYDFWSALLGTILFSIINYIMGEIL